MPSKDPRVDAYIGAAAPFAQPILVRLRDRVLQACPEVEESIRWGHPAFLLDGRILCIVSAFKAHCGLVYWEPAMKTHLRAAGRLKTGGMGHYGRLATSDDLPGDAHLLEDLQKAAELARSTAARLGRAARSSTFARTTKAPRARPPETKKAPGRRPKASKGAPSEE